MSKVDLTPELVADIKQKAKAAQELAPGTWHGGPDGDHWVLVDSQRGVFHTTCKERNIAEFIAYADPATVLALVEEIEQLKKKLRWFPARITEKIDLAILVHTGGKETIDARKELCMCDHTVGYYCEYCAVLDALTSCKKATESEAGQ